MKNQKISAAPRQLLCLMLSAFLLLAAPAFAAEGYYLTWDEYREARGVDQWNYNDQAAVIAEVANHAVDLYAAGEKDEAYEYAKATYWGYYEVEGGENTQAAYLREDELGRIKTIFWAFNLVDFSSLLSTTVTLPSGNRAALVGTWFHHHMELPTGETLDTGVKNLRTWWSIREGAWLDEQTESGANAVMAGTVLAQREGIHAGDTLCLTGTHGSAALGITNLVTASVMERSNELGLLKALGAKDGAISGLILTEVILTAAAGGAIGCLAGFGFAQIIGHTVFSSSIEMKPMVIPIVGLLVVLVTLSGGEQQRVCIARALINYPEIVLADEPTGNLDEANENIVIDIFRQLHREGTTLIVVTHDPEVGEVAQRTITLEHGRIARDAFNRNFKEA